jgi:hypothetical protein
MASIVNSTLPQVAMATKALAFSASIGVIFTGIVLLLSLYSFVEHRKELEWGNPARRWRIWLLACVFCSFLVLVMDGTTTWHPWTGDELKSCSMLANAITIFYVFEKQAVNLFLYDRAKIVHMSITLGQKRDRLLMMLRWLLYLTLVLGVPLIFYWVPFVAFDGIIATAETKCVYYCRIPIIPIVFFIADTCLAAGMLLIFLAPLYQHKSDIERITDQGQKMNLNTKSLDRMILINIRLSTVALLSGMIGLLGVAIFNFLYDGTPATLHLPIWGLFIISWDNMLTVLS